MGAMGKSLVQQLIEKKEKEQENLANKINMWHNDVDDEHDNLR